MVMGDNTLTHARLRYLKLVRDGGLAHLARLYEPQRQWALRKGYVRRTGAGRYEITPEGLDRVRAK